ncbi:MAG: hypothetical protein AB7I30_07325 [Isosphaeraceae bacterium]
MNYRNTLVCLSGVLLLTTQAFPARAQRPPRPGAAPAQAPRVPPPNQDLPGLGADLPNPVDPFPLQEFGDLTPEQQARRKAWEASRARLLAGVTKLVNAKPVLTVQVDPTMRRLLTERYEVARMILHANIKFYEEGHLGISVFHDDLKRLVAAYSDMLATPEPMIPILELKVALAKEVEVDAISEQEVQRGTAADVARARYDRIEAEIELERAKARLTTGAKRKAPAPR